PGPGGDADGAFTAVGRALAHVVDRAGRVADARQQTVGAANDLDLLVAECVQRAGDQAPVVRQADAVDLRVLDLEAAGDVVGAVGLPALDPDAGGEIERVVDVGRAERVHQLAVDDADGLRRFRDVEREPGGAFT